MWNMHLSSHGSGKLLQLILIVRCKSWRYANFHWTITVGWKVKWPRYTLFCQPWEWLCWSCPLMAFLKVESASYRNSQVLCSSRLSFPYPNMCAIKVMQLYTSSHFWEKYSQPHTQLSVDKCQTFYGAIHSEYATCLPKKQKQHLLFAFPLYLRPLLSAHHPPHSRPGETCLKRSHFFHMDSHQIFTWKKMSYHHSEILNPAEDQPEIQPTRDPPPEQTLALDRGGWGTVSRSEKTTWDPPTSREGRQGLHYPVHQKYLSTVPLLHVPILHFGG